MERFFTISIYNNFLHVIRVWVNLSLFWREYVKESNCTVLSLECEKFFLFSWNRRNSITFIDIDAKYSTLFETTIQLWLITEKNIFYQLVLVELKWKARNNLEYVDAFGNAERLTRKYYINLDFNLLTGDMKPIDRILGLNGAEVNNYS